MASNIISRLGTRMTNIKGERNHPDFLTRDIGGHFRDNQPYISGYFQVMFGLPSALFPDNADLSSQWLHSTCESFTPHTQAITKVDVMGQGQIGSSYPVNVITTREFTVAFREYQFLPILNIIKQWAAIFDPFTGVSPLKGSQFLPPNYKGWAAIVQTKPVRADGSSFETSDIEECYIYQGVYPYTVPLDIASAEDITANDTVQLSVTFSFDGSPLTSAEEGVAEKVADLFSGYEVLNSQSSGGTFDRYLSQGKANNAWSSTNSIDDSGEPTV